MEGAASAVGFGLLGPLEVWVNDRLLVVNGARRRALLVRLLIDANTVVPADRLIDDLWGAEIPEKPSNALQAYVSHLRSALEVGMTGRTEPRVLLTRRPGYLISIHPESIDTHTFDRLAAEGRAAFAEGRPAEAADILTAALKVWRGPAIVEFAEEPWAAAEAARLEECRWSVTDCRMEADLALGRHGALVGEVEAALVDQPLRERLWAHRMLALYRSGRQADALRAYRDLRCLLGEELGIEPSPELARLEEAILMQKAELDWRPPDPLLPLAPLNVDRPALLPEAPEEQAVSLPHPVSSFIGREAELDELRVRSGSTRVLTLTGAGGVGKTRLAVALARALADQHRDGVFWVELAALRDGELVADAVASAVGLTKQTSHSDLEALVLHLRAREVLIVLDNCEHLVASCAAVVQALTEAAPRVSILATSREPLRVAGESTYRVPSMGADEARRLFEDRASAAGWPGASSPATTEAVAEICRRLDHIPLAVELAAAQSTVLSAVEIAHSLKSRLVVLGPGPRTAPARHQTLRATLDWSYNTLSPAEQSLFRRLSVFSGGFCISSAEQVCSGPDVGHSNVLTLLGALIDKSMVIASDLTTSPTRYRMLEIVRQYASERLAESGETPLYRDRHLSWGLNLAERAETLLTGRTSGEWLNILENEHDNLREGLAWAKSQKPILGLQLASALALFWDARDQREGLRWLTQMLSAVDQAPDAVHSHALNAFGLLAYQQGDNSSARSAYQKSLGLCSSLGDAVGTAWSHRGLGNVAMSHGDRQAARMHYEECLRISSEHLNPLTTIAPIINLGYLANVSGDFHSARTLLEEALRLSRQVGDDSTGALALFHLAQIAATTGGFDEARRLLKDSMVTSTRLQNRQLGAAAITALGYVALLEGDYETAGRLHETSVRIQRDLGDAPMLAWSTCDLGELYRAKGALDEAGVALDESLAAARHMGERYLELWSLVRLGRLRRCQHDHLSATEVLHEAHDEATHLGNKLAVAECAEELALVAAMNGDNRCTAVLLGHALRLRSDLGAPRPPYLRPDFDLVAGTVRSQLGDVEYQRAVQEGEQLSSALAVFTP